MDRFGPNSADVEEYLKLVNGMPPERVQDVIAAMKGLGAVDFEIRYFLKAWPVVVAAMNESGLMAYNDRLYAAVSVTRPPMGLPTGSDREHFLNAAMTAARALVVRDEISDPDFRSATSPMRFGGVTFDPRPRV